MTSTISITAACEHNLRAVSLEFPKNKLVVVTGVSGSGKSSLIFDVLYREAESRYLGSFSSGARQFMGKIRKPDVEKIDGISPAIALDQKSVVSNVRSTVGTITGIYDLLRLLYARVGKLDSSAGTFPVNRSLFSFNSQEGACPVCKGLGVEDFLDPGLLISDPKLTLRQGALVITAPNGYIIYSQVTLDVLDQVCRSEGFNIDIPWKDLTPEQKHIIYYGSSKIEIPFGKHPLESRMKWSGITAKPREMGYYKGILPIMEDILRRDRNKNILRFVRTVPCQTCNGARINKRALSVSIGGHSIAAMASLQLDELKLLLKNLQFDGSEEQIATPVISQIVAQIEVLNRLGLNYLTTSRESTTLSGGEAQRLRMATIALMDLSGMIFIFDEPSIGLHPHDTLQLINILKEIRDRGNTVIVVEHEEAFIRCADWLIDIGPGSGINGGEVMYNGPVDEIPELPEPTIRKSRTLSFLLGFESFNVFRFPQKERTSGTGTIEIRGASANNLRQIDVSFKLNALNVVTGVSGAGKSSLTEQVLAAYLRNRLEGQNNPLHCREISGAEILRKLLTINQAPIGRTPRSNPATYTGLFDHIRDLFARQPAALEKGFEKSRFSFNTEGGRCETCQGAGYQQVGMHFMGNVEVVCEACEGRRFDDETLKVRYHEKNVSEILEMSVSEAILFFTGIPKIQMFLEALDSLGLGYLKLGQRSSTLSGGEAQRIKIATELAKPQTGHTLYIMDEPTTGLHQADVCNLQAAIQKLITRGHTVILIEHHCGLISAADHIIDLGPGSGRNGGAVVFEGIPADMVSCTESKTGKDLQDSLSPQPLPIRGEPELLSQTQISPSVIHLSGVSTNNLRKISLDIPKNKITVVTGVSGSGKSSLAFDTIHAEAQNRFLDGFSAYIRSRIGMNEQAEFETITGLTPTLALDQSAGKPNPRSTLGTITGIYDLYRLLFARIGIDESGSLGPDSGSLQPLSSLFSFNHHLGACPACKGLGQQTRCDSVKLISNPERSILDGAMDGTKTGKFYGDAYGQYVATIKAVGEKHGVDYAKAWNDLSANEQDLVLSGTGEIVYDITWEYKRGERTGNHRFTGKWQGLPALVEEEYTRKHADYRGEGMMNVMLVQDCTSCMGSRLNQTALGYHLGGRNIAALSDMPVLEAVRFFKTFADGLEKPAHKEIAAKMSAEIIRRLEVISDLGLSYLTISRAMATLSSGEARRVKLASQIGSGLTGITCVLDEPTAGLHPRDTLNLMKQIRSLRDAGNTIIMVEHNREVILAADHIIDMGPGAGVHGGAVVAEGTPEMIMKVPESLTGRYLLSTDFNLPRVKRDLKPGLAISRASVHNLKGFDLNIPAGGIVVVTGVSGSGKSSLVFDLIHASALRGEAAGCREIKGFDQFSRIIAVEQKTGFTAANAILATYAGLLDPIRDILAKEPAAVTMGMGRNHFSFLNKQGMCPHCDGHGFITTSMDFLPDVVSPCEFCKGARYAEEVLNVNYQGKNISGMLDLTVSEAIDFFAGNQKLTAHLDLLAKIGLEYLKLGQRLTILSGGEVQRLQLATEMMKPVNGPSLYLFDEPSAGLHFFDIRKLLEAFSGLANLGHTLLIIEHDPSVIAFADYIIELGPDGGDAGGYLISSSSRSR